jgi:hypothetical protein
VAGGGDRVEEQGMGDNGAFDAAWRENRAYLVDLAFRMLRDIGELEMPEA